MQAARRTFSNSGFPVCINFMASLASTCGQSCEISNLCQQIIFKIVDTHHMTKEPIMIRVVVVCPVTWCYRVEYRSLDPSAHGKRFGRCHVILSVILTTQQTDTFPNPRTDLAIPNCLAVPRTPAKT